MNIVLQQQTSEFTRTCNKLYKKLEKIEKPEQLIKHWRSTSLLAAYIKAKHGDRYLDEHHDYELCTRRLQRKRRKLLWKVHTDLEVASDIDQLPKKFPLL